MGTARKGSIELDVNDATGDGLSCADVHQVVEMTLAEVASADAPALDGVASADAPALDGVASADTPALAEVASAETATQAAHVGVQFVERGRIHELNRQFRGVDGPTDVLSFPVDCGGSAAGSKEPGGWAAAGPGKSGGGAAAGPRELGDVVICPDECGDIREGLVHGMLHLLGYDHETDQGEMLALQGRVLHMLTTRSD